MAESTTASDTVANFQDLLHLTGAPDADRFEEIVDEYVFGWIDWEESNDNEIVVCVGAHGVGLRYPFTLAELWTTLDELGAERNAEVE